MDTAYCALLCCKALIVLYEHCFYTHFMKTLYVICFHEITSMIAENLWLYDINARKFGLDSFHRLNTFRYNDLLFSFKNLCQYLLDL